MTLSAVRVALLTVFMCALGQALATDGAALWAWLAVSVLAGAARLRLG